VDFNYNSPWNFKPYKWEIPIIKAFEKRLEIWMTLHRRAGKDLLSFCHFLLPEAFEHPGTYQYIWPTLKQGRDSFWEGKDEEGRNVLDYYIPKEIIIKPDNADMKLTIHAIGGSSQIQVFGTNKGQYVALRGKPSNGAVFSEFAFQDPRGESNVSPMLAKTGGWAVYDSTPNGNNHYKQGFYNAKSNPDCFAILKTVEETFGHDGKRLVTEAAIQKERDKGKTEDFINQEYYCSFMQGVEGTYLGKQLQQARNEGRISPNIHYDENFPVYTAWDLGVADFMSIIFYQVIGNEVHIIDYYENSGYSFVHYAHVLKDKGYYYGGHRAPHDIKVREMGSTNSRQERALSRLEKAAEVGIEFEIMPIITFESGVENARSVLRRCHINEVTCKVLIVHLEQWGRKWNDIAQQYSDFEDRNVHTHGGSSFRTMATVVTEETHAVEYDDDDSAYLQKISNPYTGI